MTDPDDSVEQTKQSEGEPVATDESPGEAVDTSTAPDTAVDATTEVDLEPDNDAAVEAVPTLEAEPPTEAEPTPMPERDSIDSLDQLAGALESVLAEIRSNITANGIKTESASAALEELRQGMEELRAQTNALNRIGLRTDDKLGQVIAARVEEDRPSPSVTGGFGDSPRIVLSIGLILLSLGMITYFKTDNTKLVLMMLVTLNLAGWAMLLRRRTT